MTTTQTIIKHLDTSLHSSSSGKLIRALKAHIQSYIDLVLAPPSDKTLLRVIKSTDTNIKLITDISGIESQNMLILKAVLLRQLSLISMFAAFQAETRRWRRGRARKKGVESDGEETAGESCTESVEDSRSEGPSEAASEESPCEERGRKRTNVGEEYLESRDMG